MIPPNVGVGVPPDWVMSRVYTRGSAQKSLDIPTFLHVCKDGPVTVVFVASIAGRAWEHGALRMKAC